MLRCVVFFLLRIRQRIGELTKRQGTVSGVDAVGKAAFAERLTMNKIENTGRIMWGLWSVLLLYAGGLWAQPEVKRVSVTTEHFSTQSGLSYDDVFAIAEDSRGLIWIGTRYGLNRFDGKRFKRYSMEAGLRRESIDGIYRDGDLLLLLHNDPAAGYNLHPSADVMDPTTDEFWAFEEYWEKELPFEWGALMRIETSNDRSRPVFRLQDGRAYGYLGGGRFQQLALNELERITEVLPDGSFWTTEGNFLAIITRYRAATGRVKLEFTHSFPSWREEGAWVGYDARRACAYVIVPGFIDGNLSNVLKVYSLDGTEESRRLTLNEAPYSPLMIDGERYGYGRNSVKYLAAFDAFWVANSHYGQLETPNGGLIYQSNYLFDGIELAGRQVLIQDSVMWMPGHNGVYKLAFNTVSFEQLRYHETRPLNYRAIFKRGEGLYAVNDLGITHLDRSSPQDSSQWAYVEGLWVWGSGRYPDDTLWTVNHRRITQYIPRSQHKHTTLGLTSESWALHEDRKNRLWLGNRGLYRIDRSPVSMSLVPTPDHPELGQAIVYQILPEGGDTMLLVSTHGLFQFHPDYGVLAAYHDRLGGKNYLPYNDFRYVHHAAGDSLYWIATGGHGLLRWNRSRGTYRLYDFGTTPTNTLHAILPDDYGYFWCSTDHGLIQFDPQSSRYRVYLGQDGLRVEEFNRISYYKDTTTGELYFGTVNGVLRFHPRDFRQALSATVAGSPFLVDAYSLHKGDYTARNVLPRVLQQRQIVITPRVVQLTLGFGLTNALWNTGVTYRYRIVRDTASSDASYVPLSANELQLGRLPFGESYLQVEAITSTGQYLAQRLVLPLRVLRPFYLTWWFVALVVLAVMTLFYAAYRYQRWQDQKRNDLRTRIARDLHDNVGALLSSMLMQVQLLRHLPHSPRRIEIEEELMQNTHESIDMVRDVVWATDSRNDSYENLLVRLEEQLIDLERSRGIAYRFDVKRSDQLPRLSPEVRQHIYFIFREAITNTLRHSRALAVRLRVAYQDRKLVIEYIESLPLEGQSEVEPAAWTTAKTGQGIQNMHQRAQEIGGTLYLEATPQEYRVRYEQAIS